MGGKKKKAAAAAAPVAPAAAAAAGRAGAAAPGNSVAGEPKKQPHSNKPAKPAKENKSKGGINYLPARKPYSRICLVSVSVIHKIQPLDTHIVHMVNQAGTQHYCTV